jgi:hypothetical protein
MLFGPGVLRPARIGPRQDSSMKVVSICARCSFPE